MLTVWNKKRKTKVKKFVQNDFNYSLEKTAKELYRKSYIFSDY